MPVCEQEPLGGGPFILSETARISSKGVSAQVTGGLGRATCTHFVTARFAEGVAIVTASFISDSEN